MIPVKLGIQQRVLPNYRTAFFDRLAERCQYGCSVFAGVARQEEMVPQGELQIAGFAQAHNIHILKGKYYLCWQKGLLKWLHRFDPDVVIMEANPRYIHSINGIQWLHNNNKRVIGWGLGAPQRQNYFDQAANIFKRKLLSKYDLMITYSNQGKEEYIKLGYPENKIFVAPNSATFTPKQLPQRDSGDFEEEGPKILFVGRLQARKRIDLLIRACEKLKDDINPQLWIVGDGPERVELEKKAYEHYVNAKFFGGIYGEDLEQLFLRSDLFVLPGTGGLAVQQAMAHSLPVIVAEADGTQVDLVKEKNGWCVEPGNFEQLTETIRNALSDPERLRKMGRESFRIIRDEVNLDNMLNIFSEAVVAVLSGDA